MVDGIRRGMICERYGWCAVLRVGATEGGVDLVLMLWKWWLLLPLLAVFFALWRRWRGRGRGLWRPGRGRVFDGQEAVREYGTYMVCVCERLYESIISSDASLRVRTSLPRVAASAAASAGDTYLWPLSAFVVFVVLVVGDGEGEESDGTTRVLAVVDQNSHGASTCYFFFRGQQKRKVTAPSRHGSSDFSRPSAPPDPNAHLRGRPYHSDPEYC
jgi:hypothetical protein